MGQNLDLSRVKTLIIFYLETLLILTHNTFKIEDNLNFNTYET